MASYAIPLSFLLAIVLLTTLKAEARESRFFSKFNPQVDQPPLKPSSEINNDNAERDIPTEEFIANINEDSPETNEFSPDFDDVTVPRDNKEKDSDDVYYPDKFKPTEGTRNIDVPVTNGFDLTAEEGKFFDKKKARNGYGTSYKNDDENVHVGTGMSDTMTLVNGKNNYKPTRDNRDQGEYNDFFGNSEFTWKRDAFRPLKDFDFEPQN